jgi:Tol biopolymer transport system component
VIATRDVAVLDLTTRKHKVLVRGVAGWYAPPGYLVFVRANGELAAAPFDQDKLALTGNPVSLATGVSVGAFGAVDLALGDDGTLVYVAGGNTSDAAEIVWADRNGVMKPVQPNWRANFTSVSLSPDGKQLAVGIALMSGEEDIWIKQLDTGPLSRLTFGGVRSRNAVWIDKGTRVAFVSEAKAPFTIAAKRSDGNGPVETIVHEARSVAEAIQSRDGQWILYRTSSSDVGHGDILGKRAGDSVSVPLVATPMDERHPALSPDGHWLAYRSMENGVAQVFVRPFPNVDAGKWQVSNNGGSDPVWSHSGKELFFINGANQLVSAAIVTAPSFSARSQTVLFTLPASVRPNPSQQLFDVSPDDKRFVMIRAVSDSAGGAPREHLIVVRNWFEELKARVPR